MNPPQRPRLGPGLRPQWRPLRQPGRICIEKSCTPRHRPSSMENLFGIVACGVSNVSTLSVGFKMPDWKLTIAMVRAATSRDPTRKPFK
jgi:hypothetical protein